MKNNLPRGRGGPQKHPKGRFAGNPEENASDFGGSDVDSDDFYHDEIDDFHADQEKMLLGDDGFRANLSSREEEEEIMPITDEEDEDDDLDEEAAEEEFEDDDDQDSFHKSDMESDLDDKFDDDDGFPGLGAWGKKSSFFGADFADEDRGKSYRLEDEEKALAEEEAGTELNKINLAPLKHKGVCLDEHEFKVAKNQVYVKEALKKDLDNLAVGYRKKIFKKESPEYYLVVNDFRNLMKEFNERLSPLYELVEAGRIKGQGAEYICLKRSLILHYCLNISFYMMLKSKGKPTDNHPVIKRLSQYRELLNHYKGADKKLKPEIDYILEKLKNGKDIEFNSEGEEESLGVDRSTSVKHETLKRPIEENMSEVSKKSKRQKVKPTSNQIETETEKEVTSLYMDMKKKQRDAQLLLSSSDDEDDLQDEEYDLNESKDLEEFGDGDETFEDGKRTITYQIAKNKGLLPYRNKEYRNPRVRNRMKYRRAKIRRKGQVREPRREITKYGGELTGIRKDVSRSIKIK